MAAEDPKTNDGTDNGENVAAEIESRLVTVIEDPINFTIKHALHRRWTLWFDAQVKKATQANWHDNLKKVVTISTVEDFWGVYNNIIKASQIAFGSNYHLFKEGVQPMWEDPANANGGKWVAQIQKAQKRDLDQLWLNTMLACIGEMFEDSSEVCGAVVSVRRHADRLSLWTASYKSETRVVGIGNHWKSILAIDDKIGYQAHSEAMQANSSFSNTDKFTV
ncbi:translation initiation factor eIF 4e-like domain-containing protein [Zopfochytrium polystomum]|nr:translation initiation factor eIF 4e-like domain-containing protein [Zopfochytrium polystomum]